MMRYAQIDENGICIADSMLSGSVDAWNMIPLANESVAPIGMKWNGSEWEAPSIPSDNRLRIAITSIACDQPGALVTPNSVTCVKGGVVTVTVELRYPEDSIVPLTMLFRMPLIARDGRENIVLANFVDGVATISSKMDESGVWLTTEAAINQDLPEEMHMKFDGLAIYVSKEQ